MDKTEIIEFYEQNKYNIPTNEQFINSLVGITNFLGQDSTIKQRIWHVKNDVYQIPACEICKKELIFDTKHNCYNKFCSKECKLNWNKKNKEILSKIAIKSYENLSSEEKEKRKIRLKKSCNNGISKTALNLISLKYTGLNYDDLLEKTKSLDKDHNEIKIGYRMYAYNNNDYNKHYCIICNRQLYYNNKLKRFPITCCKECKTEYQKTEEYQIKIKNSILKKYGVDNVFQLDEFKENQKSTMLKKYGVNHNSKMTGFQETVQQTCLERYGVNSPLEINKSLRKQKTEKTCLERYGTKHYENSDQFKNQRDAFVNINFENILIRDKIFDIVHVKNLKNHLHKFHCNKCNKNFIATSTLYGSRRFYGVEFCINCNPLKKPYSSMEKDFSNWIKSIYNGEILTNNRSIITPYELDVYLPELNLAFEFNGTYYHADPRFFTEETYVGRKTYNEIHDHDKKKLELCKQIGIDCYSIWEYDWINDRENLKENISSLLK